MKLSLNRPLLVALVSIAPFSLRAQGPAREVALGAANATSSFEFSLIRGLRELVNGTVLVAAPLDGSLLRIDPTFRRTDTLGRTGHGPGEYVQPDGIWPLPADSSLLVDLGNNRLSAFSALGKFGNTMPIMSGGADGGSGGVSLMLPGGVDRQGSIYYRGSPGGDSVSVLRFDRATKKSAIVAMLKAPGTSTKESTNADGGQERRTASVPLSPADGWAVTPSGTLYVVRTADYHVDVYTRLGTKLRGAPVAFAPVKIGDAEKKEYQAAATRSGGIQVGVENRNGEQTFSLTRGRGGRGGATAAAIPFPPTKPPFDAGQILVDGKERLWVLRHQAAGRPALYDVFDPRGTLIASVRLPASRVIVGMGAASVYVAHVNEDDLQLLERYALPL